MANFKIVDLAFCDEIDSATLNISGGASAGAAAAANYNDALASAASTSDGDVYAYADGSYSSFYSSHLSYDSYSRGPSVSVSASDRYYYY